MKDIKIELKDVIENLMIPEVESYLEDLHKVLEKNEQTEDDMTAIKELESFLVELQNIIEVIKENSMPDSEYQRIYDQIMENVNEHKHEEE